MNFQTLVKYAPVTFILIMLIVGYFGWLVLLGVDADSPAAGDLMRYGANVLPFTLGAEPWRLVSAGFLHIGIMHLLFNGFALYYFGQVAERIFGAGYFLATFLLAVIGGNLLSLSFTLYNWLHYDPPVFNISAGASGGIMGLGAALLVLSYSRHPSAKSLNQRSLLFVMALNLLIGWGIAAIDNAAHIGGALTGVLLTAGFILLPKAKWLLVGLVLLCFVGWWGYLAWVFSPYLPSI